MEEKNGSNWQKSNLAAIHARLKDVIADKELAKIITSDFQGVFLRRIEENLELYCYNQETNSLSEIMSRIELTNPLKLVAEYSKAVILSAGWRSTKPKNIYIAGIGGGRLAMLFHHLFPEVQIDGSDIDPSMITVCKDYFGLDMDDRLDIQTADSRTDLAKRDSTYDIIILDVFFGQGEHPNHLATVEFLQECRERLTDEGVIVTNLVNMDEAHQNKIAAIAEVFPHCMDWDYAGAHVIFGAMQEPDLNAVKTRVQSLMTPVDPSFNTEVQIDRITNIELSKSSEPALRD